MESLLTCQRVTVQQLQHSECNSTTKPYQNCTQAQVSTAPNLQQPQLCFHVLTSDVGRAMPLVFWTAHSSPKAFMTTVIRPCAAASSSRLGSTTNSPFCNQKTQCCGVSSLLNVTRGLMMQCHDTLSTVWPAAWPAAFVCVHYKLNMLRQPVSKFTHCW